MNQIIFRGLLNGTSLATLLALLSPLAALSLFTDTATASTFEATSSSLQVAELPDAQLKDDDDDDDDDDDYERVESEVIRETTTTTTVTEVTYTDIATDYWANDFIYRLASINIVSGYPDGEFLPNTYLTKAHYAAMVTKAFNKTAVREVVNIRNVSQYYWAYDALRAAYSEGWIDLADDDTFDPESTLTKLEMWVMLARSLGYTKVTSTTTTVEEILSVFDDADTIPVEYREIVAALVERGIIVNYPVVTELNLSELVTRAEACSYLYQAMASLNLVETFYSQYIVDVVGLFEEVTTTTTETTVETTTETNTVIVDDEDDDDDDDDDRRNCNQGRGNGSEGCDPGNSRPHGGSNDGD